MQNAKDALSVVNQLSVKENLTDAQYIQLMEQSRLAILKAGEAVEEAVKDMYFDDRKQVQAFVKQAQEMKERVEIVHQKNPYIEIVAKLLPAARQYTEALVRINQSLTPETLPEEHEALMTAAKEAFLRVCRAYEYVSRFESDDMPKIKPLSIYNVSSNNNVQEDDSEEEFADETDESDESSSQFQGVIER